MNTLNRCANTKEKVGDGKVQQSKLHSKDQMASILIQMKVWVHVHDSACWMQQSHIKRIFCSECRHIF